MNPNNLQTPPLTSPATTIKDSSFLTANQQSSQNVAYYSSPALSCSPDKYLQSTNPYPPPHYPLSANQPLITQKLQSNPYQTAQSLTNPKNAELPLNFSPNWLIYTPKIVDNAG